MLDKVQVAPSIDWPWWPWWPWFRLCLKEDP